jgi:hypothetical protein
MWAGEAARELRAHVWRAGGSLRMRAAELAAAFGEPELRGEARERIARALGEEGVRSDPRLDRIDPDAEHVLLYLHRARLWRPRAGEPAPAWLLAVLGAVVLALGAVTGILIQSDGEDRTTTITETIRTERVETDRRRGETTVTVREVRTVTERETVTTTVKELVPAGPLESGPEQP